MLKKRFKTLCKNYTDNEKIIELLWEKIEIKYTNPNRYYHSLEHLEYIYKELEEIELNHILEFSIFYHDIIYDVKNRDNEEQSAKIATIELSKLNVPENIKREVSQLILETKTHQANSEQNRLFLDADLAILGDNYVEYRNYICNIRKEYTIYNDEIYNSGRMKVLEKFLEKEKIYQSEYFYEKYEKKAKYNLSKEYKEIKARYSI